MLPTVVDNSYDFGCINKDLFGHEIPIGCSVNNLPIWFNLFDEGILMRIYFEWL